MPRGRTSSEIGTSQPPKTDRRGDRITLEAEVALRRGGQLYYSVRVFDVSRYGCRVEFVVRPKVGELVWVKFKELEPVGAFVCWIRGALAGLEFERPVHEAVFDLLLKRISGSPVRP